MSLKVVQALKITDQLSTQGFELGSLQFRTSAWLGLLWTITYSAAQIVAGIYMARSRNWARLLFLWSVPVHLSLGSYLYGLDRNVVLAGLIYIIMFAYLVSGNISRYYRCSIGETC